MAVIPEYRELSAVIVAGGSSRRFGRGNKLLHPLAGVPLFIHSLRFFSRRCAYTVIAVPESDWELFSGIIAEYLPEAEIIITSGGTVRSGSVRNALRALPAAGGYVAVHDAARPLLSDTLLGGLYQALPGYCGVIPGKPVTDTLKCTDAENIITGTVSRERLWRVETPQVFRLDELRSAYAAAGDACFTDDAAVMEAAGYSCRIIYNPEPNVKLTYAADLPFLEQLAAERP